MSTIVEHLWLIPCLPLVAAALAALTRQRQRRFAASLAIGSMAGALLLSSLAFVQTLRLYASGAATRQVVSFRWFQLSGDAWVKLGWILDPLTAVMLVMVCFVGLVIFIYSLGYMAHDPNCARFFCFLALFAAAMLGLIIANSLLLFFICWELVGLTSYLLIGFWHHKPSAAAAAKKAFITTRIGDLAFFLGLIWLYSQTGTLLFYDAGQGCLETAALSSLSQHAIAMGLPAITFIGLLLFCGAMGKSGQVPLHVWLPDAMEGPTPVSALIHAATMVAAGVFLVGRVYPLMAANAAGAVSATISLQCVTWVGAITALFAASIAIAQTDIKRILAYSTVSQLGFMMVGLGTGGVAVGMFHLITHAFFKALLFLGAGSVIHGCHEEQDITRLGGLRRAMPFTFAAYAAGMLALSGFPLLFSGFWSKEAILHEARGWSLSHGPFYLAAVSALLTAFYMTRQVLLVFFGESRLQPAAHSSQAAPSIHESPAVMVIPLLLLAACSIFLGFIGTPAWPWFQSFLGGEPAGWFPARLWASGQLTLLCVSALLVFAGMGAGWHFYGRGLSSSPDPLERLRPDVFWLLKHKFFVDEIYEWSVVRFNAGLARACDWLDRWIWSGMVLGAAYAVLAAAWVNRALDERVVNYGFDELCQSLRLCARRLARFQNGQIQHYLRALALGLTLLVLLLIWGCQRS